MFCRVSPSTPPPSSFMPPLLPPPPLAHHIIPQRCLKPQQSNMSESNKSTSISQTTLPKNLNNNNSDTWDTLKDIKPDLRALSEERRRGLEDVQENRRSPLFRDSQEINDKGDIKAKDVDLSFTRGSSRLASGPATLSSGSGTSVNALASESSGSRIESKCFPNTTESRNLIECSDASDAHSKKRKRKNSGRAV